MMNKKLLLSLGLTAALAVTAKAQMAKETFNSGIPATWSMIKGDSYAPSTSWVARIQTELASKAWMTWPRATGDSCVLTTSRFTSPTATADRWIITPPFLVNGTNVVASWEDFATETGNPDLLQVRVSTGGTTAADFATMLYNRAGTEDDFGKNGISLAAYNGQTIRLAFRDNSTAKGIIMLDNVGTEVISTVLDAGLTSVTFPTLVPSGTPLKFAVKNNGYQTITSLTVTYAIDGGTAVSQTFSGLTITPFATENLAFSTALSGLTQGSHSVTVTITQSNGAPDPVTTNNVITKSFIVPGAAVTRAALLEEFTSSTCVPCAAFNVTFDPLILANNANVPSSNFNVIKYQMNWPSPGTDLSYNPHGLTRRTLYNVTGIPDHFINGQQGGNGDQAEIDNSKTVPAFMTITGTYTMTPDSIIAVVTATPNFTMTNSNLKLYMAATEKHYTNNKATTTQKEYYHVMRSMLPNGDGIAVANWTAGQPQTFRRAAKYTIGGVAQGNFNFWNTPYEGALVAFVQDAATHEVFQSKSIPVQQSTGVATVKTVKDIQLFPNPATTEARLVFNVSEKSKVAVQVTDIAGRIVSVVTEEEMSIGNHQVMINTSAMANGIYNVVIRTDAGSISERLSIAK